MTWYFHAQGYRVTYCKPTGEIAPGNHYIAYERWMFANVLTKEARVATYFSADRIVETLPAAIREVLISPKPYFEQMPPIEGFRDNLVMLGIILLPSSLIMVFPAGVMAILFLPLALSLMLVTTWLWARYLSWAVRAFTTERLDTASAFQICAYSSVPMLFSWLPVLNVLMSLWNMYLTWRGLVSHARLKGSNALLILLVPLVIFTASLFVLFGLLFYLMGRSGLNPGQIPGTEFF